MGDKERGERFTGMLGSLFGGRKKGKKEAADDAREPAEPILSGPETQEISPVLRIDPESALYALWRKWDAAAPPPSLSLSSALDAGLVPEDALEQEKNHLWAALESCAKERLDRLSAPRPSTEPAPALPARCCILPSLDWMAAWCYLLPPVGDGAALSLEDLGKTMQTQHITAGIESEALTKLFMEKRYFTLTLIARGTLVEEGSDGRIHERYPREHPQGVQTDDTGRADYRAQSYVQSVQKGSIICDIVPPQPGKDGLRVDGKPVKPRPVKPARIPKGSNTTVSEDGACLIATMSGHLEYSGSVFQVKSILEIPGDVDYATGNIDFRGDVHIRGDVRENFSVRATGCISIEGLVEAAVIEAGGDVVISNGVLGDNKALIKSRGIVRAKYLENCVVYSGECTYAECILASQVFSNNGICVTSGRGTVIGGGLTAAVSVQATVIGSKSGRDTDITLGVLPYVQEEMRNNEIDLRAIQKELKELSRQLTYLEGKQGMSGSSGQLAKHRLRKSVLAMKEDKLLRRQQELEEMRPDLAQCRLTCGTVYPITKIKIGKASRNITQVWTKCTAVYDMESNEIKFV